MLGVPALCGLLGETVKPAVCSRVPFTTKLFLALAALVTHHATVNHTTDGNVIADLVVFDFRSHIDDAANDFVAWHKRIVRLTPVVTSLKEIRMANSAVKYLDCDVVET